MGVVLHIIVVGFHHAHGPIVEYAFPPFPGQSAKTKLTRLEVPEEWSLLPFLALPDGSHQSDEDFTYFHLPPVKGREDTAATLFGISCNRQVLTKDLVVKTDDVTRSSVQKAVVPIFGILRQRLAVVTAAWFGQRDFTQTDILAQFYGSLNSTVSESIPDSAFLMGTALRELVKKFKYKVLVLLKLLLLEKRVIFFGYPVETLCTYQYSLVSLIPGLLKSLQDTGSPLLDSQELYMQSMSKTPAQSTDKQALFKYLGLPLHIFGEGSFFQPYLPLQQIDILQHPRTRSYIIGTTNAIFLHNRDCATDVIVNTEPGTIEFLHDSLSSILSLTSADRRWMDEIIESVNNGGDAEIQTEYIGSEDYLRAKFEEYILTLLSSVKHSQFTPVDDSIEGIGSANDKNLITDYGTYFVKAWQETPNYQLWNDYVDWELLNEIVAPGHPCQGNFSLAHVQRRLANQFKDMRIDKNLAPLKQSFSRAMSTSRSRLSNVFDTVWQEFEKLQPEEGANSVDFEPAIYSQRTGDPGQENKGLVKGESTKAVRPVVRSVPDAELIDENDDDDAIVPPTQRGTPVASLGQKQGLQRKSSSVSRTSTTSSSPVSSALSTLGPATAATAAIGQKAAGMLMNVSSFFQAKKKEYVDTQRESDEQYQQRIHQHERRQKVMQERARATASTFAAISPKIGVKSTPPTPASTGSPEVFAYVPPKSPVSPRVGVFSPSNSINLGAATGPDSRVTSPSPTQEPIQIVAPVPIKISPTLTREGVEASSSDDTIEKELQEALESESNILSQKLLSVENANRNGSAITPTRSLTPAESYSPFLEISAPSTPFKPETAPLAMTTTTLNAENNNEQAAGVEQVDNTILSKKDEI
ncbi:late secretory pathway protein avl9 [Entomortierella beljakovae]|nr:late secretory pathway protein avl9 [Entomortierella beljakovae]